jgi:hypothetical protein
VECPGGYDCEDLGDDFFGFGQDKIHGSGGCETVVCRYFEPILEKFRSEGIASLAC